MRGVAALVAGAAAAAFMALGLPWDIGECGGQCTQAGDPFTLVWAFGLVLYMGIPLTILVAMLVAILGIRAVDPGEAAVRAALGETPGTAVRRAAWTGLRHGLIVATSVYVMAGAVHVALEQAHGWEPFSTGAETWAVRAEEGILVALSLSIAHVIAVRRPRRTPVERLREDAEAMRPLRLGRGAAIVAGLAATAAGVIVGLALDHELAEGFVVTNAAGIAWGACWILLVVLALAAVLPWARGYAPRFVALAAGLADGAGAPRLAAVLAARASSPTKATGRTFMTVGLIAFAVGALATGPTAVAQSDLLVTTTSVSADSTDLRDELAAIDGVERVVVGEALAGLDEWQRAIAVDPADLRGIDDEVADALETHPGAAVSAETNVRDITTDVFRPSGIVPLDGSWDTFVSLADVTGPTAGTTYLVYAHEGADREAIDQAATAVETDSTWSSSSSYTSGGDSTGALVTIAVLLGLVLTPVAFGAVKAGSREAATFAALGAEPRLMRQALTLEGAVVAGTAVAAGMSMGAAAHMVMAVLGAARGSLTGVITDSYTTLALESVPWAYLVIWGALILGIFTAVTALASAAIRLDTPAEALRNKETVR
ncbi:hypothetical protein [Demequina mangrovi]|uniref:FtsX-like permease family protein n=1 Tax=Demequina mangrovi TaxID=1043493 RepID=A0A1H7A9W3_9MICO|nr:hypothetical protein [Demequina mangrovi]SEJ62208.1 hypothetical protein SAMN05421637_2440 [Demequina mangrovi]